MTDWRNIKCVWAVSGRVDPPGWNVCVCLFILDQLQKECGKKSESMSHRCLLSLVKRAAGSLFFLNNRDTYAHTHAPHISKYQANDAHKSPCAHIITVDFPLRSHNCSGASRTLEKGFMRCSLWQPVTLAGHKYYCSWWEREHGLIEMRKQASLHWWNKDL